MKFLVPNVDLEDVLDDIRHMSCPARLTARIRTRSKFILRKDLAGFVVCPGSFQART